MKPSISTSDKHHIETARQFVEQGDLIGASTEIKKLGPDGRLHASFFKLRWLMYTKAGQHSHAFIVSNALTRLLPNDSEVFRWCSHSARLMNGGCSASAYELLVTTVEVFPDHPAICYDLARYACCLGNMCNAQAHWQQVLTIAKRLGCVSHWVQAALAEPDLQPLFVPNETDLQSCGPARPCITTPTLAGMSSE